MAVEITYVARNVSIPDNFRDYAREKFEKIENLTQNALRLEIKLVQQSSHTGSAGNMTVELTLRYPGEVVRAESSDNDKTVAFDHAFARLQERLRRLRERRKGNRRRASVREVAPDVPLADPSVSLVEQVLEARKAEEAEAETERQIAENGEAPVTIRQKVFASEEHTLDEAIDNMELLGHDFYLFIDSETKRPSVAYRRRGWSYGVISLDDNPEDDGEAHVRTYRPSNA